MNIRIFLIAFSFLFSSNVYCQNITEILYGIKLGQYIDCVENNFGKSYKTMKHDGSNLNFHIYIIDQNENSYISIGEYEDEIYSIQVFSTSKNINPSFRNIKMGADRATTIDILGKPDRIIKNDIGGDRFEYNNSNFSIEINDGKLSSILIYTDFKLYKDPTLEQLPTMEDIKSVLQKGDNSMISKMLSPTFEFVTEKEHIIFSYPWEKEIIYDYSNNYKLLNDFFFEIKDLTYTKDMRLVVGEDPLIVYKFQNKKGKKLEIVFRNEFGKYLIWEVHNYKN